MNDSDEMAPAVRNILDAARARGGADDRLSVDARSLPDALAAAAADDRVPVIAELKPTSPTTDGERTDDPVALAREMVAGGAAALSVLTEPEHFGGDPATLARVRAAVDVPVLRKDFVVREAQLDTVAADVVLLIVRFLDEPGTDDLGDLLAAARERGFQVLVEAHTEGELERALDAGASLVGVNNRDLTTLSVDLGTVERVAPAVTERADADVTLVAESGIETPADAARMRAAGADGLLVGSAIMDGDVRANTERLTTPATQPSTTATQEES
jgi:indole-3-glycerol phosphate synthase